MFYTYRAKQKFETVKTSLLSNTIKNLKKINRIEDIKGFNFAQQCQKVINKLNN